MVKNKYPVFVLIHLLSINSVYSMDLEPKILSSFCVVLNIIATHAPETFNYPCDQIFAQTNKNCYAFMAKLMEKRKETLRAYLNTYSPQIVKNISENTQFLWTTDYKKIGIVITPQKDYKKLWLYSLKLNNDRSITEGEKIWDIFKELPNNQRPFFDKEDIVCCYGYEANLGEKHIIKYTMSNRRHCYLVFFHPFFWKKSLALSSILCFPVLLKAILGNKDMVLLRLYNNAIEEHYDLNGIYLPHNYQDFIESPESPISSFDDLSFSLRTALAKQYEKQIAEAKI